MIFVNEKVITVTEAARNFADCVNRAHYQDTTFVLVKNGKTVAKLVPPQKRSNGRELAAAMSQMRLTPEEARQWYQDLAVARKNLQPPADKWA